MGARMNLRLAAQRSLAKIIRDNTARVRRAEERERLFDAERGSGVYLADDGFRVLMSEQATTRH